jgi:hypothetical protein
MRVWALLLCAGVAVPAPVPKSLKKQVTLDGRWKAVSLTHAGSDTSGSTPAVWDVRGDTITRYYAHPDGTLGAEGLTITLTTPDPAKPDEIDYTQTVGQQKTMWRTRVRVTADELVIRFAEVGAARPDDVSSDKDSWLYRFKRVEEK